MSDFEFMAHHKKLIVNDTFVHFFNPIFVFYMHN